MQSRPRTTWTPSPSGDLVLGNAVISASYYISDGTVYATMRFSFGSTTVIGSGGIVFQPPHPSAGGYSLLTQPCRMVIGGAFYAGMCLATEAAQLHVWYQSVSSGTGVRMSAINPSAPGAWGVGSIIEANWQYPAG